MVLPMRRRLALICALPPTLLIAVVPAIPGWFPELSGVHPFLRLGTVAFWGLLLGADRALSIRTQRNVDRIVENAKGNEADLALRLFSRSMEALLDTDRLHLPNCRLVLYIPDSVGTLIPTYPDPARGPGGLFTFQAGSGVVGAAVDSGEMVIATGRDITDPSYRLTDTQSEVFSLCGFLAGVPIKHRGSTLGALLIAGRWTTLSRPTVALIRETCDQIGFLMHQLKMENRLSSLVADAKVAASLAPPVSADAPMLDSERLRAALRGDTASIGQSVRIDPQLLSEVKAMTWGEVSHSLQGP